MKRFRSPFQKIQRIQQQQLRIAELNLARAQAAVADASKTLQQLQRQSLDVEQDIVAQLSTRNIQLKPAAVHASRAHLENFRSDIQNQTERRRQLLLAVASVQSEYRELKARCDGVDQLMNRKQIEHRRQAMLDEQTELEESARTLRLLHTDAGDDSMNREYRSEVKDGAIQ